MKPLPALAMLLAGCSTSGGIRGDFDAAAAIDASATDGGAPSDDGAAPVADGATIDGPASADVGGGGGNVSGSRLRAIYLAGADGSKQWAGWHDSMLNVDCSYVPAADGNTRCLPVGGASAIDYFAPGCTQRLAQNPSTCPATYATQPVGATGTCGPADFWHVFPVQGPFTGPTAYVLQGGNCVAAPSVPQYAVLLGPEVDATSFVGAIKQTE